jgi:hypothetical protein
MADDPNKSDKPVNGQVPKDLLDILMQQNQLLNERTAKYDQYTDKYEELLGKDRSAADIQLERRDEYEIGRQNRINEQSSHQIGTFAKLSNINQITTTMSGKTSHMVGARGSADINIPTEVLERRIQQAMESASVKSRTLSGYAGMATEEGLAAGGQELLPQIGGDLQEAARLKAIIRAQKQKGLSTEKIYRGSEELIESAEGKIRGRQMEMRVGELAKSGDIGSESKEFEGFIQATEKAKTALEAWQNATNDVIQSEEELTKAKEDAVKAEKELLNIKADAGKAERKALEDKLKAAEEEVEIQEELNKARKAELSTSKQTLDTAQTSVRESELRTQAAKKQTDDRISGGRQALQAVSSVVGAIGGIGIDDEIKEMKLKTFFAGTANEQFFRKEKALQGDMTALYEEASTQAFVEEFTRKMGDREGARATANNIIGVGGALLDTAEGAAKGGLLGGPKGAIIGGVKSFLTSAPNVVRNITAQVEGLPQGMTKQEAYAAARGMAKQISAIPGYVRQKAFDQAMTARDLSIGLGGGSVNMQQDLTSVDTLDKFADVGVDRTRAVQLAGMARQIGATAFAGTSPAELARRAGEVEMKTKIMGAEQYMGSMAQLAQVGAGQGDLETIMKNAVAAGMDNAKNVQQMVQATLMMSSNLAKSGLGAKGVGGMAGASIQRLVGQGVNRDIAAQAVSAAAGFQQGLSTEVGADLGTVFEMEQLMNIAPNMSDAQRMKAASLSQPELQALMGMDKDKRTKELDAMGLDYLSKDQLQKMARVDKASYAFKLDAHILGNQDYAKDMQHMLAGEEEKVSKDFKAIFSRLSGGARFGATVTAGVTGVEEDAKDVTGAVDRTKKTQAKNEVENLKEALKGFGNNMNTFVESTNAVMTLLKDNLKAGEAKKRVGEAAEGMLPPKSITDFKTGSKNLLEATNKMLGKMGLDEHSATPPLNMKDIKDPGVVKGTGTKW